MISSARPLDPSVVITWASTSMGGAEVSTRSLARALSRHGVTVRVIWWRTTPEVPAPRRASDGPQYTSVDSIHEYQVALERSVESSRTTALISNHPDLRGRLHRSGEDVDSTGCRDSRASLSRSCDKDSGEFGGGTGDSSFPAELQWSALLQAAKIVGVSDTCVRSIEAFGARNVCRIFNPVDEQHFSTARQVPPRATQNRFRMLGRLVKWKRFDVGIVAFTYALSKHPEIELEIVGDGPARIQLEHLASETGNGRCIRFRGELSRPWSASRLPHAIIAPSPMEAFGRSVVEANARAIVGIGPNSGAAGELIIPERNGFTFAANDALDCERQIASFLALPPEGLLKLANQARADAWVRFRAEVIAKQWHTLLATVSE